MKTYMSLWTRGISFSHTQIDVWKLSLALAKKHYSSVSLITDNNGYEIFKTLPFDEFHIELNNVPDYKTLWSLGKIYSYQYICNLNEPFLHLDGDVLLWEKLPETLTSSYVFVQSEDEIIGQHNIYNSLKLQADLSCAIPYEWLSNNNLRCYNMGIFGGTDLEFINEYCNFVINMINNPLYNDLWTGSPGIISNNPNDSFNSTNTKSTMLEQGNFAIFCKQNDVIPNTLFVDLADASHITYKKYSHLSSEKNNTAILNRIASRVSQEPYDLIPRNVPIENWNLPD